MDVSQPNYRKETLKESLPNIKFEDIIPSHHDKPILDPPQEEIIVSIHALSSLSSLS